jgi:hypothetical protein
MGNSRFGPSERRCPHHPRKLAEFGKNNFLGFFLLKNRK